MTIRSTHGWAWAVGCLCSTVTVGTGCGAPLCPSTTFPAMIFVSLSPDWPTTPDMELTVSCPREAECGFLDGPITGAATESLEVDTVLRPAEVEVEVRSADGSVVHQERVAVSYEPRGPRQTDCGGDAQALVLVPSD